MKRAIFKRIFVLYAVIILSAVLGTELYVTGAVRESHINTLRDNLAVQASLIAQDIPFRSTAFLDGLCRQFKELTRARVTIIAVDGRVLGDSDHDSATMDNHMNRLEMQQASLDGTGMAVRHSDTLGYDLLYVAKKITNDIAPQGFIRLSVPLKDVDASVNLLRIKIILAVSAILAATGLFSFWQIERLRRLTGQIRDFATALARGDLGKRLFLSHGGEFNEIAGSLNAMSAELQKSIAGSEEEKKRLNVILRTIPDALLISDADGMIRLSSAAAGKFFGSAPVRGKRFSEVVRNREFLSLVDEVRRTLVAGAAEFPLQYPEERHMVARVAPLSYREGEVSGFAALFHDITRLRALERMRKDFVANVSHELKTPIAAIQGFAETLLEGALENRKDAGKFVEIIHNHSARLHRLVEDLLTLSRIELGEIQFHMQPMDIRQSVENSMALIRQKAESRKISLSMELEPGLSTAHADPDRITQVMVNLLDNAVKFTPEGGSVRVIARKAHGSELMAHGKTGTGVSEELSAKNHELDRDFIEISVIDTGPGIPPMLIPRLGERFYRVDPARSRELGGTGLGLAIVKHILQAHGSGLTIKNAQRHGTAVSFCLPAVG